MSQLSLWLVRHGQTPQNEKTNLIGQDPEEPLTDLGVQQSLALGAWLIKHKVEFSEIYHSIYKRAHDTCRYACSDLNIPLVPSFSLREYSPGDMKGKTRSEVITGNTQKQMNELGMAFKFPRGESLYEVEQRAVTWIFETLLATGKAGHIALFSHGMTIKCILHHFLQFDQRMTWRIAIDNTSISRLDFKDGRCFLHSINTIPHLNGVAPGTW